jgi:hypothetical protein
MILPRRRILGSPVANENTKNGVGSSVEREQQLGKLPGEKTCSKRVAGGISKCVVAHVVNYAPRCAVECVAKCALRRVVKHAWHGHMISARVRSPDFMLAGVIDVGRSLIMPAPALHSARNPNRL